MLESLFIGLILLFAFCITIGFLTREEEYPMEQIKQQVVWKIRL